MTMLQKQPFKIIEIPLNKFIDEAVPHHKHIYQQHKTAVHKLISSNKFEQLNKEVNEKKRTVRQLRDLLYELDTLRTQVENADLDKFDDKTFSLRKSISSIIKDYANIQTQALQSFDNQNELNMPSESPFQGASQIYADLSEIKLKEEQDRLKNIEAIEVDVQDLHGIYVDLNQMVQEQAESIDQIENNVEETNENVQEGLKQLIKASKFKAAAYPVTGALIGTLIGGPLGLVAGFKIGGIAAIGCGIAGYSGGKYYKNCNTDLSNQDQMQVDDVENIQSVTKKDI